MGDRAADFRRAAIVMVMVMGALVGFAIYASNYEPDTTEGRPTTTTTRVHR